MGSRPADRTGRAPEKPSASSVGAKGSWPPAGQLHQRPQALSFSTSVQAAGQLLGSQPILPCNYHPGLTPVLLPVPPCPCQGFHTCPGGSSPSPSPNSITMSILAMLLPGPLSCPLMAHFSSSSHFQGLHTPSAPCVTCLLLAGAGFSSPSSVSLAVSSARLVHKPFPLSRNDSLDPAGSLARQLINITARSSLAGGEFVWQHEALLQSG